MSTSLNALIKSNIEESLSLKQTLLQDEALIETVGQVGQHLAQCIETGGKIFFFGNGGSAADAQHLAAELVGRFERERRALPGIALTVNTSSLTAIGNDYSYESVFARQLEGLGRKGDVAVGISTSGKSPNVLAGLRAARAIGIGTIGMTGHSGAQMAGLLDYLIAVPAKRTARVQEAHMLIGHILCEIIETRLFRPASEG